MVLSAFYAARALAVARRAEVPLASYSGWCFQRFTPRGVLTVARRDEVPLACYSGGCFPPLCAARGAALARGPRSAAAAFLASLMRR